MRRPESTPEPFGGTFLGSSPESTKRRAFRFVVQQHAARRMHWDVRLEIGPVLASWAVPRGPSLDPRDKRLAVQTEDHPLEYASFEGVIPPENYGAGPMIVWDRGSYEIHDGISPQESLRRGKIDVVFHGHKLRGRWLLVRIKGPDGRQWLLIKKAEPKAATGLELITAYPHSILSGLTVEEVGRGIDRTSELAEAARQLGAHALRNDPRYFSPMLAEAAAAAFRKEGWYFELKYDGVRAIALRRGGEPVRLLSRNRHDFGATFPEIADAVGRLPCSDFVLDGEIVTLDAHGVPSFELLQQRLGLTAQRDVQRAQIEFPVVMFCFDLLSVAGLDLRSLPLRERKTLLRRLVPNLGIIRYCDHVETEGVALYRAATEIGLEGVVGKRADSVYENRRSRNWLKVKAQMTADLAVVGVVAGKTSRRPIGSLMLAWRKNGDLVYAGNVGTGFDHATLGRLFDRLSARTRKTPAFRGKPPSFPRGSFFVEPELVATVRYAKVTEGGILRHPVFVGIRDDKTIEEIDAAPEHRTDVEPRKLQHERNVAFSNLDKIFWPENGYTKGDLIEYYRTVWPYIQPYLRDRPLVLTRYPDGIHGKSFFQKNAPDFVPEWIETYRIEDTSYFVCNDIDALLYVINLGCIPLHIWSARTGSLDRPDWAIIDLDPKGAPFSDVARIARHTHLLLDRIGAPNFLKTSGQEGLHILIPLAAGITHEEARTFAEVIARLVAKELPELATIQRNPAARGGKVYVDYLQNGFGKTIAAPLSVRPRPGAPVSMPLRWSDLSPRLDPSRFTIRNARARVEKHGDPLLEVLRSRTDIASSLRALEHEVH